MQVIASLFENFFFSKHILNCVSVDQERTKDINFSLAILMSFANHMLQLGSPWPQQNLFAINVIYVLFNTLSKSL